MPVGGTHLVPSVEASHTTIACVKPCGRKLLLHCVLITLATQLQPELHQLYSIASTSACGTPMLRKSVAWKLDWIGQFSRIVSR